MSTATATNKTNGRSTRNAIPLGTTKRSSRSATPNQDVEKTPTKNSQQTEKSIKAVVAEEISKILEETPEEILENTVKPTKASKKTVEAEKPEKTATKSHKKSEEDKPVKENSSPEKPKDEKTNGVEEKTTGSEKKEKDKKEVKEKTHAKTNGDGDKSENGVETEEQACIKNGTNDEDGAIIVVEGDKPPATVEIMDEPMLTLSEDDEKSSLHDSFDVECTFESSSPTFSPKSNRSMTRRSHAKTIPTPETPKAPVLDNISEKTSTSNGTSEDEFIVVDDSEKESNAGTDIIIDDVTSTEMQDVTLSRNSPFRRSPRLMENASLIANYSGSTTRDSSMDENSNGNESLNDSLNTSNDTIGEPSPNYGRSLRSISGRRSVRPLREVSFRNVKRQTEASRLKNAGNDTQSSMNVTVGTELNSSIGSRDANKSLKRERSATPVDQGTDSKKFKSDASTSNFIMSYIPSPMTALRRRFYGSRISSSTPNKASASSKPAEAEAETGTTNSDGATNHCTEVALINSDASKKNWCAIM